MAAEAMAPIQQQSSHKEDRVTRKKEMSMSTRPKGNRSSGPQAATTQAADTGEASVGKAARAEDIRRRAYEIYLERREQPGRELDDWLQAERELENGVLWHAHAS
jgi:hypothetical protein